MIFKNLGTLTLLIFAVFSHNYIDKTWIQSWFNMHWFNLFFSSELSLPSMIVNFPSVINYCKEGYETSEIATLFVQSYLFRQKTCEITITIIRVTIKRSSKN